MRNLTKLKTLQLLTLVFALFLTTTSCTSDPIDETAIVNFERVDLKIDGSINEQLIQESSDLTNYTTNATQVLNPEERKITIQLGNKNSLELTLFNSQFNNPLVEGIKYNAYSKDQLDDKISYVIGEYFNDGIKVYSSISSLVNANLQLDVFRTQEFENHYLVSIDEFNMFELSEDGTRINNVTSIVINGTFTLLK